MKSSKQRKIKAYGFQVLPLKGSSEEIAEALKKFAKEGGEKDFSSGFNSFKACDGIWHADVGVFTGSVLKLRSNDLPSAVTKEEVKPLPIESNTNLGEPMCFAYRPKDGVAIVHYSHSGPRHPTIPVLLSHIGFPHPVEIDPILREDMRQRLENTRFISSIEFALHDSQSTEQSLTKDLSVKKAIEALNALGGVNIRVDITMGHSKKKLLLDPVKSVARNLMNLGHTEVTSLKINAAEGEDQRCEQLDLLGGRRFVYLDVIEKNRELDRSNCQKKLMENFHAFERKSKK